MKIAYVLHWNEGGLDSGVFKKVLTQVHMWANFGHEVHVFLYSTLTSEELQMDGARPSADYPPRDVGRGQPQDLLNHGINRQKNSVDWSVYTYSTRTDRLRAIASAVSDVIVYEPDIVYFRYDLYYRPLKRLFVNLPVVVEINTNDVTEMRNSGRVRHIYNRLTRRQILTSLQGAVFVTRELSEDQAFSEVQKSKRFVVPNGIPLENVPQLDLQQSDVPQLVFVGSAGQPWQGVDKILSMASHFHEWRFYIIGAESASLPGFVPPNVTILGRVGRETYEPLLAASSVAIGTLALHRKGMNEACPLKVREYLAYGLPVIIAYQDTHFDKVQPFLLELPNSEDNIESSLGKIQVFVERWVNKRVEREQVECIDARTVERSRLAVLANVVGGVDRQTGGLSYEPA